MITHDVDPNDRDFRIQFSTDDNRITLVTQDFSRGTDFKLKVKDPKNHPGLHIICAYFPTSLSDYIQLTGRTGRQGKNGSVFILMESETEVAQH
jgi:superfamily II DNA/RNA helicase